jgi:DNA replication protein DnaC
VRGLCERGISARYVSWALWLDDMRQAMGRDGDMAALKARIERPAVVALDDIGRERDTDWAQSQLDQLLERRTLGGGTVLIASNLTDEALEMHLGDRLWSRIRANTRPVVMTGKDWRAAK